MSTAPVCPLSVWQVGDAELLAELGALEARLHSTWAQMLSVVAEIDSRGMAGELGYGTTVGLVRAAARVSRGEAQDRIAADDVLPGRGVNGAPLEPKLSATAAAVAEGAIGAADVAVIRSVLSRIPEQVAVQQRAEVEAELARHARTLDGGQLAVLGKRILVALPTEGGERPQVVVTVSLLCSRAGSARHRWRWAARSLLTSPAASPATQRSSQWCWAREVNRWMWAGPAEPYPPRSAAR
jgi:Domain of unknown function (DUF222)